MKKRGTFARRNGRKSVEAEGYVLYVCVFVALVMVDAILFRLERLKPTETESAVGCRR